MQEKYAILKKSNPGKILGTLHCINGAKYAELERNIELIDIPLHFRKNYSGGVLVVDNEAIEYWISTRIPPPYRQDLRDILREFGMDKYDSWELFKAYGGRSVRDDFYIEEITPMS